MWNIYRESEKHETLTTLFFGSGTKLLFTFSEFKVFRHEEREREREREGNNFLLCWPVCTSSALDSLTQQTRSIFRRPPKNRLPSSRLESQLSVFFKFQHPQPIASGHDVIQTPAPISYLGFLLWHLWLSHPPLTHVNTCTQCVHLTNPCTKAERFSA